MLKRRSSVMISKQTFSSLDGVAQLGLLCTLALHAEVEKQRHDAKGDRCTCSSSEQQYHQAHSALFAGLYHTARLSIVAKLTVAFTILTDSSEITVIFALAHLDTSVAYIVHFRDAKLLSGGLWHVVLLIRRYICMSVLRAFHCQTDLVLRSLWHSSWSR